MPSLFLTAWLAMVFNVFDGDSFTPKRVTYITRFVHRVQHVTVVTFVPLLVHLEVMSATLTGEGYWYSRHAQEQFTFAHFCQTGGRYCGNLAPQFSNCRPQCHGKVWSSCIQLEVADSPLEHKRRWICNMVSSSMRAGMKRSILGVNESVMPTITSNTSSPTGLEVSNNNLMTSQPADSHATQNMPFTPQYPGYGRMQNGQIFSYGTPGFAQSSYMNRCPASDSLYKNTTSDVSSNRRQRSMSSSSGRSGSSSDDTQRTKSKPIKKSRGQSVSSNSNPKAKSTQAKSTQEPSESSDSFSEDDNHNRSRTPIRGRSIRNDAPDRAQSPSRAQSAPASLTNPPTPPPPPKRQKEVSNVWFIALGNDIEANDIATIESQVSENGWTILFVCITNPCR